jgi:N4-gp56 family major capsid protein
MAMELIGIAGMTVELKQTYDRTLLERAVPALVHTRWGLKRNIPRRGGKSIEFRRLETITATTTALTEGTAPTETQLTFSNVQATVSQYGAYSKLTDLVDTQSYDPVLDETVEAYGEQMGDSLDQVVRNVLVAGTTVQYASTAGSRGAVGCGMHMTYAEIREIMSTLKRVNAKPVVDNKFIGIIHSDTSRDMFADSDIITTFQNAGPRTGMNPLITGEFGDFYGVRWIETSNARIFASEGLSGADVYGTLIIGRNAYGVTELDAQSARAYIVPRDAPNKTDPLNQYMTVGWKAAITAVILNENFIGRVEHTTSRSNSA